MITNIKFMLGLILCLVILSIETSANPISKECDENQCDGPLKYYEELGCTAIYERDGNCCPEAFICQQNSSEKCVKNGHEYKIGEKLPIKGSKNLWCTCVLSNGKSDFTCNFNSQSRLTEEDGGNITCMVDGKKYYDGDFFQPKSEPKKSCFCSADYKGKNVEPFCITSPHCNTKWRKKCAPIYGENQLLWKDCSNSHRCQKKNDVVVPRNSGESSFSSHHECIFGTLTLKIGESLEKRNNVECTCKIPPILTCRRK